MRWIKWTFLVGLWLFAMLIGFATITPIPTLVVAFIVLLGPMRIGMKKDFPGGSRPICDIVDDHARQSRLANIDEHTV